MKFLLAGLNIFFFSFFKLNNCLRTFVGLFRFLFQLVLFSIGCVLKLGFRELGLEGGRFTHQTRSRVLQDTSFAALRGMGEETICMA